MLFSSFNENEYPPDGTEYLRIVKLICHNSGFLNFAAETLKFVKIICRTV